MAKSLSSIQDQKKTSVRSSFQALRFIPRFFREIWSVSPSLFLTNLFCRLINAFSPVVILWVGKLIIDEIITQVDAANPDYTLLWNYVLLEFGIVILSDILNRLTGITDGLLGDRYNIVSSEKMIRKTSKIDIGQLEDSEFYDKLERARQQTQGRVGLMSTALAQAQSIISIGTLIAGLIYFQPILIVLLALSIIPLFINEIRFSGQQYSISRSWTAERRELDYLRYIGANDKTAKEIKLFGLTDFIAKRFRNLSEQYFEINKKLTIKRSAYSAGFNVLGVVCYYGAYLVIIRSVLVGEITIGELTFLSASFNRLRTGLQTFFTNFTRITESALYLKDYFDFIDLKIADEDREFLALPKEIHTGFEIRDLHFAYPGSDHEVLKGVSFKLNAGEKMAFVGQNGAGKTTLIKLMLRFYEPTQGEILLDGININNYNKAAYQQFFGVIFQDFFRYEFTLRENIAVGDILAVEDDSRIVNAAQLSLANEVIETLHNGYDTQLGKRFKQGQELSGGQWQKVALARAYMKDAKVMVLDEPTSALDAKAEYEVFERFIDLTKGKTSIIISHRFSTVRMADRILVLQHGKILELGTHEELMQDPMLYAELFDLQAQGYK
ncbi:MULTISPECIES: ABC transporter ATP-binding protein [unclassified Leeuwenhoekiella]|uniref:ABC transporter ATP-binding protein n=1 Tax=unclassified Leeuwenhoekiella TaxID=2615029 RepID=UPI000C6A15DE|nr:MULTISPECIES: ABC transporter ATP-binding protein [unclassified Leeuwenhoekiella]MAW96602.1 ABC transporter ATP-binding protein [Leeuwenhoekiella sp.]MBA81490.1 ABC transporter ATP-binding protein [Leeuwenhoekiella sp.]|tara:strand:+ start:17106 stop:18938 length:1833 start_codon:yes stop_codon:yes gene_type:complete